MLIAENSSKWLHKICHKGTPKLPKLAIKCSCIIKLPLLAKKKGTSILPKLAIMYSCISKETKMQFLVKMGDSKLQNWQITLAKTKYTKLPFSAKIGDPKFPQLAKKKKKKASKESI